MSYVEREAASVDEAVAAALGELGLASAEDAEVEILQEAKAGLLGLGKQMAKVRVTARGANGSISGNTNGAAATKADDRDELRFRREPEPAAKPAAQSAPEAVEDLGDEDADEGDESDAAPARREPHYQGLDESFDPAGALESICRMIDDRATVVASQENDRLILNIECEGSGIFIGRRGATLDALQYLINRMTGKQNPKIGRIVVDSEDYRDRKYQRLVDDAWDLADQVKKRRRPAVSEPLSAFDRRIIHTTLRDDGEVATRSLGDGEFKRVQVYLDSDSRR
ncbi:MAG: Jag N-terminal domain-containing protein [Deltaproteobacteria bacterium]|nr:Jag N-terminal domain-containing protein [Deltaproteobacteria bacterium]MCB9479199.1 Jag N-terminal domain-containing protein [Deltaproteobacteria bacterium]MCB9490418.1 Jag N-terminal domain-containing protein [Deltaproteobacteria bacterium]